MRRKRRVRVHFNDQDKPSMEGFLLAQHRRDYIIGVPSLLIATGRDPAELESRQVRVPREQVWFYEELT